MVEGAQERGYLEPAELEAFAVELDLNDEDIEELTAELERIGLEISTPAAAAAAEAEKEKEKEAELAAAEAAASASGAADSLQLFLADVGKHKLLTAADEVMLAKAIERGDPRAKRRMIESNLRLVVSIAKGLSRPGRSVSRPDPGRHAWAEPRGREVRLAPRLQVLDVCDVVDPPVGAARRRESRAHDPRAGPCRRAPAEAVARSTPARGRARTRGPRRKSSPRRRVCRCSTSTRRCPPRMRPSR